MKILWIAALFILLTITLSLPAQTPGVTFLKLSAGSRAQAMGSAYTAVARDANGMHYNPAGMGFGFNRELMLFHSEWFEDISMENITLMYPFNYRFSMGASVSYLHLPDMVRYEIDPATGGPLENGTFSVYDLVFTTGLGYRLTDHLAIGANFKFFQEQLESVGANGFAMDIGLLARLPISGLRVGLAVQHLGPSVKYIAKKELLPLTYRVGLAYSIPRVGTLALDATKTRNQDVQVFPGVEVELMNSFYVRGGYQMAELEGNGMAAGFGLRLMDNHQINYVYVPYGDLGDTHRAELIFHLGSPSTGRLPEDDLAAGQRSEQRAREEMNHPREKDGESTTALAADTGRKDADRNISGRAAEPAHSDSPALATNSTTPGMSAMSATRTRRTPVAAEVEYQSKPAGATTGRTTNTRTAAPMLTAPENVVLHELPNKQFKLAWTPVREPGVGYNIYAKPVDGSRWVKVTAKPTMLNYQVFTQTKTGLKLLFIVTTVRNGAESNFSKSVTLQVP